MERKKVYISQVHPNEGQIEGLPANPRLIKDGRFKKLVKSIKDLPEMTEARDLLVYPHNGEYIVIGGNMRLRAYQELGWKEVPCCVLPDNMPVDKLREMVIQDNNPFGETDWNMIANEWDVEELKDWGVDLPADWNISPESFGDKFSLPDGDKPNQEKMTFTLSGEQAEAINHAIESVKANGIDVDTYGNSNENGNAIYQIVKEWERQRR